MPDDVAAALDAVLAARTAFDAPDGTNRHAVLHRVLVVANPRTGAAQIGKLVAMLVDGRTPH